MVNDCQELVKLIQNQSHKWQKAIQLERDARLRMERMCEQVASQSVKQEKLLRRVSHIEQNHANNRSTDISQKSTDLRVLNENVNLSDDDEFHDAIDNLQTISVFRIPYVYFVSVYVFKTNKKKTFSMHFYKIATTIITQ